MNNDSSDSRKMLISRRLVLEAGACALGATILGGTGAVSAEESDNVAIPKKASQTKVAYRDGVAWRKCSTCRHYRPPESCRVVEGLIKPDGRCNLYVRRWAKPGEAI
jgi:hypothetical protein